MKLNQQHIFLTPSFTEWPVSDVHRQPVFMLIDGIVKVLESADMEGSQAEVESFMSMLGHLAEWPMTSRSAKLVADAKDYLALRQAKVDALSEKQRLIVMSSQIRD